jgi:hypothetical protein
MVNTKKQKKLEAGINEDNEDEIFEVWKLNDYS